MEFVKNLFGFILALPFLIIVTCLFIIVFSMTVECVTGVSIIHKYIRPIFQEVK